MHAGLQGELHTTHAPRGRGAPPPSERALSSNVLVAAAEGILHTLAAANAQICESAGGVQRVAAMRGPRLHTAGRPSPSRAAALALASLLVFASSARAATGATRSLLDLRRGAAAGRPAWGQCPLDSFATKICTSMSQGARVLANTAAQSVLCAWCAQRRWPGSRRPSSPSNRTCAARRTRSL